MSLQQMNHPNLIRFREIMRSLLEVIKNQVKNSRLEKVDLDNLLSQDTTMDPMKYSDYILTGLINTKIRQQIFSYLEKLYREQDVVTRRTFQKDLLAALIRTCEPERYSIGMNRFIGSLLTNENTRVSNQDKDLALKYLIASSRNNLSVQNILEDIFIFLAPRSEPEIKSFLPFYINWIINEVDLHSAEDIEYTLQLHKHQNLQFSYGRCFMCNNIAKNYHKQMRIPICGIDCKNKFTKIQQKSENKQTFNLIDWLIEHSPSGDQIIFKGIEKTLRVSMKNLSQKQLRILFPELLMHAKSVNRKMALLCHKIFVGLFHGLKQMLKKELGSYLKQMINQLQSAKDPLYVLSLLQLFQELYKQPDNISWIYANFDCKYYQVNLLQEQLALLSKFSIAEQISSAKEAKKCLTVFLRSLLERLRGIRVNADEPVEEQGLLEERKIKQKAQQGIRLFNSKPKVGIQYLRQNYFQGQQMTHADVAKFIRQNQSTQFKGGRLKLKKDMIGEFFQKNEQYNIQVYKSFLELLDFQGLSIDDALRELLSHFTLGKEAQQIQRVIDYFSQRYFPYSGLVDVNSCFILSYTVLMLQSNLHNPQVHIKQKMTLTDFAKLCSTVQGISRQGIQKLYSSIKNSQLSEKPQLSSEYLLEKAYLNAYDTSEEPGDINMQSISLLNSIWQYIYVGLVDRKNISGLEQAIILYGSYNMGSQTEGFLRYLIKLAEDNNIEAYDVLLRLAAKSINSLGVHFNLILKFVFEMEEGSMSYESSLDSSIVDLIFTSTVSLPDQKFIQMLNSFCKFAYSNINDTKYSREIFVLKHLIEIVDYNLVRISNIWPAVWRVLEDFFIRMGLHPKQSIAMAAIDSLKQVTLKLMRLPENPPFEQKIYMSPFLDVFDRSNATVKELIVSILGMCIGKDLKSGWDVVFEILQKADNQAVIHVIDRIVGVGLQNISDQSNRLHNIVISKITLGPINQLSLDLMVKITEFFNTKQNWLESLKTVRNKFKATLSIQVLKRFFHILSRLNFQSSEIFDEIKDLNQFAEEAGIIEAQEVFRHTNSLSPTFLLSQFSKLKEMWTTLLSSINQRIYLQFFQEQVLMLAESMSPSQVEQVYEFLVSKLQQTNPTDLLELRKLDADFEKVIQDLPSQQTGTDLIELDLEKQHFYSMSILHVVALQTIILLLQKRPLQNPQILQKLSYQTKQSYSLSLMFNSRILLRLFLWKNGFFKGSKLPGLMKQQLLCLTLSSALCTSDTIEQHASSIISGYLKLYELLNQIPKSTTLSPYLRDVYREELNLRIHNMKSVLIKLLVRMGNFNGFKNASETYSLILDLVQAVSSAEIVRAAQAPLQILLQQCLNAK